MFLEGTFNLEGADAIGTTDDHVVGAAYEPEVAVFVFIGAVTGDIPVTADAGLCGFWVTPVFLEHPGRTLRLDAHSDVTFFIGWQFVAIVVNDADIKARGWFTHGAGLDLKWREVGAEQHGFG